MYWADLVPCAGSEKQTRKTLSYFVQSFAEPDGVSWNMLSALVFSETAMLHAEVVGPTSICIPQSFSVLYALTDFSLSSSSSSFLYSIWYPLMPPAALISSTAICVPLMTAVP